MQGTAADITKKALGILAQHTKGTDTYLVGVVHDEILIETSDKNAEAAAAVLKTTMEEAGNTILRRVPCQADVSIASHWAK